MRISYTKNIIQVIGKIWMPQIMAAMEYTLTDSDLRRYGIDKENCTREQIEENWLYTNTGDFSSIEDFRIDFGSNHVIEWKKPDSELTYNDCMFPSDDLGDLDTKYEAI